MFMKEYKQIYGVDVSKKSVDIVYTDKQVTVHQKFTNDLAGTKQLTGWLAQNQASPEDTLFCMETTGLYCFTLTHFLCSRSIDVWVEHSTTIKRATALARGKNDKIDAQRISPSLDFYDQRKDLRKGRIVNPAKNEISFEVVAASACNGDIMIIDALGRVCRRFALKVDGNMLIPVSLESLPSGEYNILIRSASGSVSASFIKLN